MPYGVRSTFPATSGLSGVTTLTCHVKGWLNNFARCRWKCSLTGRAINGCDCLPPTSHRRHQSKCPACLGHTQIVAIEYAKNLNNMNLKNMSHFNHARHYHHHHHHYRHQHIHNRHHHQNSLYRVIHSHNCCGMCRVRHIPVALAEPAAR